MEKEKSIVKIPDSAESESLLFFADAMVKSGMFPNVKTKYGAAAIVEYGIELGLPPLVSLQTMSVISGKICMEAKAMLALAIKGGVTHKIVKKTKAICEVILSRKGQEPHTEIFTIKDAEDLGFLGKANWRMYPEEMCFSRCISKGIRAFAPDTIMGLYANEEMEEVKGFSKTTEVEEIKKEAEVEEIKDAEVVAEEDEKVEKEITKEEKPEKKKKDKVKHQPSPNIVADIKTAQKLQEEADKREQETPEQPQPEPTEENLLSDEQKKEVWRLFNILIDQFLRDPGDLDEKLRERLKMGKKGKIPNDLTPEDADLVINVLLATVEREKEKAAI